MLVFGISSGGSPARNVPGLRGLSGGRGTQRSRERTKRRTNFQLRNGGRTSSFTRGAGGAGERSKNRSLPLRCS
ncbi:hypothetical protein ANANG_G00309300 [Anguilla anguilla]|uniref:Uncharacterized protein n=1 Tax=Anguilla anguilla TaxID=7936 RepID=A0A9D3LI14_ANGAN|nr:hypothetical protein ANANG_G00309300 [Anguilla anguilla]